MLRAVIVEDEPKNLKLLISLITEFCPEVTITGTAEDVRSGEALIRASEPDLVFLDIEMPFGSGFDILNNLMPINFEVIFVTAFDRYMIQAFRYCVIDYLLKPVNIEDLKNAVQNALKRIQKSNLNLQVLNLLNNMRTEHPEFRKIAVPAREGYEFIKLTDLIRCEAKGGYSILWINDGRKVTVARTLKEYEAILPAEFFFRIHHTHLINLSYIKRYNKGRGGFVEMEDGSVLEVAIRRKDEFLQKIGLRFGPNE